MKENMQVQSEMQSEMKTGDNVQARIEQESAKQLVEMEDVCASFRRSVENYRAESALGSQAEKLALMEMKLRAYEMITRAQDELAKGNPHTIALLEKQADDFRDVEPLRAILAQFDAILAALRKYKQEGVE